MFQKTLDEHPFSSEQCDALFAALLAHDEIDLDAELPDLIHLEYKQEQLSQCYLISRQMWQEGVDREVLMKIVAKIDGHTSLGSEDQLAYKRVRAKIKHLRCACAVFDERHRYPIVLDKMTIIMGKLQDAVKNEEEARVSRLAPLFRLFWTKIPYALISREIDRFQPGTAETFRKYVNDEIRFIHPILLKKEITDREFHDVRKIISRLVAFYDCLKVLYPSAYHFSISKYLGTIYTLMGRMHDDMVIKEFAKTQAHAETLELPAEVKQRLTGLVNRFQPQ